MKIIKGHILETFMLIKVKFYKCIVYEYCLRLFFSIWFIIYYFDNVHGYNLLKSEK